MTGNNPDQESLEALVIAAHEGFRRSIINSDVGLVIMTGVEQEFCRDWTNDQPLGLFFGWRPEKAEGSLVVTGATHVFEVEAVEFGRFDGSFADMVQEPVAATTTDVFMGAIVAGIAHVQEIEKSDVKDGDVDFVANVFVAAFAAGVGEFHKLNESGVLAPKPLSAMVWV